MFLTLDITLILDWGFAPGLYLGFALILDRGFSPGLYLGFCVYPFHESITILHVIDILNDPIEYLISDFCTRIKSFFC